MFDRYYVTGGTGFLGRAVLQKLAGAGAAVRALVLPGDPLLPLLPPEVQAVPGDLTDDATLDGFFAGAGPESCVIHCAGIISIATNPAPILRRDLTIFLSLFWIPYKVKLPEVGSCNPQIRRIRVVFPAPVSPAIRNRPCAPKRRKSNTCLEA